MDNLEELAAIVGPPAGPHPAASRAVGKICARERVVGVGIFVISYLLTFGAIGFLPGAGGKMGCVYITAADVAAFGLAAVVHVLLVRQAAAMASVQLGERPLRAKIGSSPGLLTMFALVFPLVAAADLAVSFLEAKINGRTGNALVLASFNATLMVISMSCSSRITLRAGDFRVGWASLQLAGLLGAPLTAAIPLAYFVLSGTAVSGGDVAAVGYCALIGAAASTCGAMLAMAPVPLDPDGRPSERYPASLYSGKSVGRMLGWVSSGRRWRRTVTQAYVAVFSLSAASSAAFEFASGALFPSLQAGLAVLIVGSITVAALRRAVATGMASRSEGVPATG